MLISQAVLYHSFSGVLQIGCSYVDGVEVLAHGKDCRIFDVALSVHLPISDGTRLSSLLGGKCLFKEALHEGKGRLKAEFVAERVL